MATCVGVVSLTVLHYFSPNKLIHAPSEESKNGAVYIVASRLLKRHVVEHSIDELCARKQNVIKGCRINLSKLRNGHLSYREPQIKK